MSRYTGPKLRIVRKLGIQMPALTTETPEDRPYPPGMHGPARRRRPRRISEYAVRLNEKQKLRYSYGLTETQLRNAVRDAAKRPGASGENLLKLLERRLDNVVFRLGMAPTAPAARQLVRHGHILVNGRRTTVPGQRIKPGDRVEVAPKSRAHPLVMQGTQQGPKLLLPSYLERFEDGFGGVCLGEPERDDVPIPVDERLVIEFYAR